MAPRATEPRHVLTVLNLARRKALYTLLVEITAFMRSQIDFHEPQAAENAPGDNAPLLIDPSAENSIVIPPAGATPGGDAAPPSPALVRLRAAAVEHFDGWRKDVMGKFKELLSTPDDAAILEERRKRTARIAQEEQQQQRRTGDHDRNQREGPSDDESIAEAVARLQAFWHPIPTRLATIPEDDRKEALSCVLLMLLSTGHYSANSRALAVYLTSALELPLAVLDGEEVEIAKSLVERSTDAAAQQRTMSAEAEAEKRKQQNQSSRYWKVGLASVAGAAIIGVTGGLAAPVVAGAIGGLMGSVGLGGVASFLGVFWMNGALVGTLFGAFGARMTGELVDQYAREVKDFRFIPLKDEWGTRTPSEDDRRLRVTIGINGWLTSKDDVTKPFRALCHESEAFALRYEMKSLLGLGESLQELVSSYAWNTIKVEILKRTVLATLWSALWPAYLLSMANAVDNPFSLAKNRSEKAGEILADALINRVQGERPVTLIGYSLGARVIYSCLRSLAARRAFGLVDSVVFIGAPVPSNKRHWEMMRTVVSGKLFNVYSENDYLLAFLYRATSVQLGVAGLQQIRDVEGVENLNLSDEVQGHMRYSKIIPKILAKCGIPVVNGAGGPIEEDEDIIKLNDLDKDNTDLIDFGGLDLAGSPGKIQQLRTPLTHSATPEPQPSKAQLNKQQTAIVRPKPAAVAASQDLLDLDSPDMASSTPTMTAESRPASTSKPQTQAHPQQESSLQRPVHSERVHTEPITLKKDDTLRPAHGGTPDRTASFPSFQQPVSPVLISSHSYSPKDHGYDDNGDDSDEDGGIAIKMVDNDQDHLAHCDPTPMGDLASWR
ncbi:uncharacterized protein B0T15DRAFT_155358 [Chaetomium strumarium]|uniref:Transmembrane and coiled-coil domain-containing protein n=1 Tax=Chaetomium strumarium TaxID=1170767 RepID=A0AAJ0GVC6_9PEZI|nr:hypothetical protein B0T15DRAFT_155358 [Chaetomium strumarium]